ncbi:hypothetical protein K438DRAFT_1777519 [Mycena galopus ATCC 62051]|nr:hypothetical protein K438DRAFT_1777519 [Mycena galopus ATCC 62051]
MDNPFDLEWESATCCTSVSAYSERTRNESLPFEGNVECDAIAAGSASAPSRSLNSASPVPRKPTYTGASPQARESTSTTLQRTGKLHPRPQLEDDLSGRRLGQGPVIIRSRDISRPDASATPTPLAANRIRCITPLSQGRRCRGLADVRIGIPITRWQLYGFISLFLSLLVRLIATTPHPRLRLILLAHRRQWQMI